MGFVIYILLPSLVKLLVKITKYLAALGFILFYLMTGLIDPNGYIAELAVSFLPVITVGCALLLALVWLQIVKVAIVERQKLLGFEFFLVVIAITSTVLGSKYYRQVYDFYQSNNTYQSSSNSIKFMSANIYYRNEQIDELYQLITKQNPDVLSLIEISGINTSLLEKLAKTYPYTTKQPVNKYTFGVVLLSKLPVTNTQVLVTDTNKNIITTSDIKAHDAHYKLYQVHTTAPVTPTYMAKRNDEVQKIAELLKNDKSQRIIIAGDFNLSPWSQHYKTFESTITSKYKNAAQNGKPIFTWTLYFDLLPITSHIDHVFTSTAIVTSELSVVNITGSDHKAVVFEFE